MNKKVEKEQEVKKLAILLRTMTNGYMLDVNNEGYMYFDAPSLLEGFCIHVGMERLEAMTMEEIKEMLDSLKDGSAVKKLQAEVTELKALVDDQKKQIRELKIKIKKELADMVLSAEGVAISSLSKDDLLKLFNKN